MKAKRWIAFLVGVVLVQGIVLLFCTEGGLMCLYPFVVRTQAESYQPKGSYTVYYDMRLDVTDAAAYAVGVDVSVAQSYDAFTHLFRFLKQYRNITTIVLCAHTEYADAIAARMEDPLTSHDLPPVLLSFADDLAAINDTQPPTKKFHVVAGQENVYDDFPAGSVLYLMDKDTMHDQPQSDGVLQVEMQYVHCDTDHGVRQDVDLPFRGQELRYAFLPSTRIDWFYRYYEAVSDPLKQNADDENRLRDATAPYTIWIENGTAAEWSETAS